MANKKAIGSNISAYANTDLNSDWSRTETTIGIKISF